MLTADRRILDRGSTDSFIMAVPRFENGILILVFKRIFLEALVKLIIFVFGMIIPVSILMHHGI
jgi:hypothetical protein